MFSVSNFGSGSSRKLAAIMFSDIKGFSQKMSDNESAAMILLKAYDSLMRVLSSRFEGQVLKCVGDLFMIDFRSSVNAVRCAIEAQQRFWNFNKDKSELARIEIRIGIHMGDVLVQENEIIGESVNISSLIEALAEPNRILISNDIYQQIKNKLPIQVYSLGSIHLKDLSDPIEIYEILIESIPELASPSPGATLVHNQHNIEQALRRKTEEAEEAQRIEETRQQTLREQAQAEEKRKKDVEELYQKAEKSVQQGDFEGAEQSLHKALNIDSGATLKQQPEQSDSKKTQIQLLYKKAQELLEHNDLQNAEMETNKIFEIDPLHVGAQQLLEQIENKRYEEMKSKAIHNQTDLDEGDDDRRIVDFLGKIRIHIAAEEFKEAMDAFRELYLIDPNHREARRLEAELHESEKTKMEQFHGEVTQREETQRQEKYERLRRQIENKKKQPVIKPKVKKTRPGKLIIRICLSIILGIILVLGVLRGIDYYFPRIPSIAVLRFTPDNLSEVDAYLLKAFPSLIANDLARCEHIDVIAPSSSLTFEPSPTNYKTIAATLQVQYLVTGTINKKDNSYIIVCRILDERDQIVVFTIRCESKLVLLHKTRSDILHAITKNLEIKTALPEISPLTSDREANELFLSALGELPANTLASLKHSNFLFKSALKKDPTCKYAYIYAAGVNYQLFDRTHSLVFAEAASNFVQEAMQTIPNNPLTRCLFARHLRLALKLDEAKDQLDTVQKYAPSIADMYRERALLLLMQNKQEEALQQAMMAERFDPKNLETFVLLGLTNHFQHQYSAAVEYYTKAIQSGFPSFLLTRELLANAFLNGGHSDSTIEFYQKILERNPLDYQCYYQIGQSYQWITQIIEAQDWLQKGLKIVQNLLDKNPADAIAHAYAGLLLSRLGQFANGQLEIVKALELDSSSTEILFRAADLYSIQKNKSKAFEFLRKALSIDYKYSELLNPDLSFVAGDPDYGMATSFAYMK